MQLGKERLMGGLEAATLAAASMAGSAVGWVRQLFAGESYVCAAFPPLRPFSPQLPKELSLAFVQSCQSDGLSRCDECVRMTHF